MSQEIKICSDASGCFVGGLSATDTVYTQKNVVADGKVCIGNSKLVLNGTTVSSCAAELNLLDGFSSIPGACCVGDITQVVAGTCLTGGGTAGCVTINHSDTSSQSSVNNSNGTVIQDVTLDGVGHVTALGSANLDGRYYTETEVDSFLSGKLSTSGCAANSALLQGNAASAFVKTSGDSSISGSLTVDDITINASNISDAGTLYIDAGGDIHLDADGGEIVLADGGTNYGHLKGSTSDLIIQSLVSNKDIIFKGNDGGSVVTALTLDMSDAGSATFSNYVNIPSSSLRLGGIAVTSTATELNLLDGFSSIPGACCVGDITQVVAGTNLTGGGTAGCVTINAATGGAGAATYGSTSNGTKIDTITLDAYGRVTAVACGTTGDITSVVAGTGLTGGATSGDATLNVIGGDGITANANDVAVDSTVVRTCGSQTITGDKSFSNDVTVAGDLTVTGDITCKDTIVSITSALSVVNTGTGPALTVQQDGTQPIACFRDKNGDDIIFADDGKVCIGNSKLVLNGTTVTRTAAQINAATSCSGTGNITCITTSTGLDGSGSSGTVNIAMDLTELTLGAGLDSSATGLSLDLSELTDMTGSISTSQDEVILLDNGAERRKLFCEIFGCNAYSSTGFTTCLGTTTASNSQTFTNKGGNISQWTNNSGYTTCTGTGVGNITCITTSAGLDGSGSSGTVNISLDLSELTDGTGAIVTGSDEIVYLDAGSQKRKLFCEIFGCNAYSSTGFTTCTGTTTPSNSQTFTNKGGNISQWTNNSGYTTCAGTTTASNSQTFTNKGGNISQWTNNSGYTTCTGTGVGNITCVTTSTGLDGGASSGTATISLDLSELTDMTGSISTSQDEIILLDNGAERRKAFCEIFGSNAYNSTTIPTNNNQLTNGNGYTTCAGTTTASNSQTFTNKGGNISQWTNNSGYTTCTGDITGVTAGTLLDGGGTSGSVTLNVDLSELSTSTTNGDGDFFVVVDSSNAQRKLTKGCIAISEFSNNAGYTTCTGDITGVTAGSLLDGGGSSGSVTLNVDLSELTDMTQSWATGSDEFVVLDSGSQKRKLSCEIFGSNAFNSTTIPSNTNQLSNGAGYTTCTGTTTASNSQTFTNKGGCISQWTNNSGYTTCTGDITGVTAGSLLDGGGTSGSVTLNVDLSELTDGTGAIVTGSDEIVYLDAGSQKRKLFCEIFGNNAYNSTTIPTNNNQLTNGNGYTTCTGTTTNSNSQTFTNKGGNISQWTNNSGYTTCTGDITNVSAGTGISGGGSSGSVTLTLDMSELTDMTATMVNTDEFIVLDNGADRRKAACEISNAIFSNGAGYTTCAGTTTASNSQTFSNKGGNISQWTNNSGYTTCAGTTTASNSQTFTNKGGCISQWTNNSGYTTCTGDITNVSVGTGLDGGGASGSVTISLDLTEVTMGTGLDSTATGLTLDLSEFTDMTGAISTSQDEIILLDNGAERRKAFCEIFGSNAYNSTTIPTNNNQLTNGNGYTTCTGTTTNSNSQTFTNKSGCISQWTNNSGYTTCTGDITGVTAGDGISGGGTSGGVSVAVDSTVIRTTGSQSLGGTKTFTSGAKFSDSVCAEFGNSSDLVLYHNGTSSFIDNDKNHLCIRNNVDGDDGGNICIMPHDNEVGILIHDDGNVCLYNDNAVRLCTQSYGAKTQGTHCASFDMKAPIGCFCNLAAGGQSRQSSYGLIVGNCGSCCGGGSAKFCGTVQVCGSFSKSSGCFDIVHPLPSLSATKRLSHSFVESPQADNIYSGVVDLTAGKATVNIDEIHGMTSGTLTALNRCFRTFTTNETNWDPVRGSVTGNTLTVESCVADSTATVSWMVLGERHDPHMREIPTTDEEGRARVEYTPPADIYSDGDWEEL